VPAESPCVFDVLTWKEAGELLFEHASRGDVNASRVLTTWRLVYEALKDARAEKKVASAIQKSFLMQMYHLRSGCQGLFMMICLHRHLQEALCQQALRQIIVMITTRSPKPIKNLKVKLWFHDKVANH